MRNLEDLNGNFPDTRMMENLRREACSMMARGASTMVAARQIRRMCNLPVPFLSKYEDRWDILNAETMRATAKRRAGKRVAPWNEGEKSRGRDALVREAEMLAIAKGFKANLFQDDDAFRSFESDESEEGTLHTTSSTTADPNPAQDLEPSEREMAETLLALSTGQRPTSTRRITIRLHVKPPGAEDPEVVNSEMEDRPVETKRKRKSQGTRHTTTSGPTVPAAPRAEATEMGVKKVARTRRLQPQGTRRTAPPATSEPIPEAQSQEATVGDVVQKQKPMRGTKRRQQTPHPVPARNPAASGAGFVQADREESWINAYMAMAASSRGETLPGIAPGFMVLPAMMAPSAAPAPAPAETTAEPAAKRAKKSPNDSGASQTSVEERKLTREEEFELAAKDGAQDVHQQRQSRARRPPQHP